MPRKKKSAANTRANRSEGSVKSAASSSGVHRILKTEVDDKVATATVRCAWKRRGRLRNKQTRRLVAIERAGGRLKMVSRLKECAARQAMRRKLSSPWITPEILRQPKLYHHCGHRLCGWCANSQFYRRHRGVVDALKARGIHMDALLGVSRHLVTFTIRREKRRSVAWHGDVVRRAIDEFLRDRGVRHYIVGGLICLDVAHPDFGRDEPPYLMGRSLAPKSHHPSHGFHVHAHAVIDAKRMLLRGINLVWRACVREVGGSGGGIYLGRLRRRSDVDRVIGYVLKNLARRATHLKDEEDVKVLHHLLSGRSMYRRFGTWASKLRASSARRPGSARGCEA